MSRVFRFLTGFISGMAFGALLALMWSPSTGPDLRTRLQERVLLSLEEGRRAAEARRQELVEQLEAARRGQ